MNSTVRKDTDQGGSRNSTRRFVSSFIRQSQELHAHEQGHLNGVNLLVGLCGRFFKEGVQKHETNNKNMA